jgi:hypothetical protein
MKWLAILLSLLVAVVGAIGVVSPAALVTIARHFETTTGLFAAAALRILLGAGLFFAAPTSREPGFVRALGVFVFLVGLVTPFLGTERVRELIDWWSGLDPLVMRALPSFTLLIGSLLVWLLLPSSRGNGRVAGG